MKQLTELERSALASAYCAWLLAACSYSGYSPPIGDLIKALDNAIRVGARLGVPENVLVKRGDHPNPALARFADWLEKDAAERARRAAVLS